MKKSTVLTFCVLLSGCGNNAFFHKQSPDVEVIHYICDEGLLEVQRDGVNKKISLSVDETLLTLTEGLSAVGQRYSDGVYVFWFDGDKSTVYNHDRAIRHNCRVQPEVKSLTFEDKLYQWFGAGRHINSGSTQQTEPLAGYQ
ncbi:MliC family protein [Klebsiella aerogenes]|uniref:MliC family protein n=1 Tax=Klebsiella aerogenes TaxID=548 RepID=UPI0037B683B4